MGNLGYKEAAKKHQINYNNIYSWVSKYRKHGPAGLKDGRGRGKSPEVQTETEKLKAQNAALKAQNQWLEMENEVLKKAISEVYHHHKGSMGIEESLFI